LGLGLYYVDQIIKAHQGSIKVVSELGKGAAFTISIPSV
ncbi:MAG: ATP-binding protein, partial [Bacteroidota bacterium]